jgi:NADPH:quinone reductase-like Zn-dependent oxidoreductase
MGALTAKPSQKDLLFLKDLLEKGEVKPVLDRHFPLAETAEAFRYLGTGHARGKVVVKVVGR